MVKVERVTIKPITTEEHDAHPVARRVKLNGRPTTLCCEQALWNMLRRVAEEQNLTLDELCTDIAEVTAPDALFSDAARAYVIGHIICENMPDELLPDEIRSLKELGYTRSMN
jgi:predicted DNA-binding ribbon-helix-helix protein